MSESRWDIRYAPGEPASRVASGAWTNRTIADYAQELAQRAADTVLIIANEEEYTVAELLEEATALARGLVASGLRRGDTITFQLPNWVEVAVLDLACTLGGFILNPIVPIYRKAELSHILRDARTKAAFVPQVYRNVDYAEMYAQLAEEIPSLEHVFVTRSPEAQASTYDSVVALGRNGNIEIEAALPDDVKQVIYTSGTTGAAKGVLYTHNQARRTLFNSYDAWCLRPGTTFLIGTPVTHVSGFSYGIDVTYYMEAQTVLMERWDADKAVELIDRHGANVMVGATPFLQDLVGAVERAGSRVASLKVFFCGGAAVPPSLIRRANEAFENCRTFRVFGSSECPMITQGCPEDVELSATTDGRIRDYEVKVVDEDGTSLPPDTDGELLARGAAMFRGYTDPAENLAAFDPDGFFRTGDIGRVTADGVLTVTGRKKDLIIRGGENLSAKEIEDALHQHPDIKEAAAVSMPHPRLGEGVCVYLIPAGDARPDQRQLAAYLAGKGLAPQKWPERIEYADNLPRTASGKVQKHILRSDVAAKING